MSREQAALLRLVLACAAWAIGETLTRGLPLRGADVIVSAALAIGAYRVTEGLGRQRNDPNARYWRGRRIDDDARGPRRWN